MSDRQREKAEAFLRLHQGPATLVLPNAWDVVSARIFEQASFQAIGTTSNAIAASLGYLDGERIPFSEMVAVIERIAQHTDLPVNADIESGYGMDIAAVAGTVRSVIKAGAVGINLEDATRDPAQPLFEPDFQCEKLKAVREVANTLDMPLVINARTDTYLAPFHDPEAQFQETVKRANAYREAGADCIFVPGRLDGELIARLAAAIHAPFNVFATPVTPSIPELNKMGVARLSIGPGAFRAALAGTVKIATELAGQGTYKTLFGEALTKAEVENLLNRASSYSESAAS
ncbi:isocitrate lyase/phosphoenolpyruvate mutase family protein [Oryzomonas sagensis]|uniref:Isocitrate lyase/phosphoenolpyruvate mutase family protein n=1 Tax=Oryzomonas sagensis TaxID=2603857 RepID=A0ABQ6TQ79_9BACT|nr:isocitrate lyase/phosphoenolpyruvate mutase family protein [Oryzomonas sagensis]KAB0671181.1 isocitrate lyase/phosphoenolpyruvate mutase family protein [Oryzomonas sagensis]